MEDPWENPWCEEVAFIGGSYRFFPGRVNECGFVFRHIVRSLFGANPPLDSTLLENIAPVVLGTLAVSEALAGRVKASRADTLSDAYTTDIVVPHVDHLRSLMDAVTFTEPELASLLQSYNLSVDVLKPVMLERFAAHMPPTLDDGTLFERPFLHHDDLFIVAAPHRLLDAINRYLLQEIINSHKTNAFLSSFLMSVGASIEFSLRILSNTPQMMRRIHPRRVPYGIEALCNLDADKVLCVLAAVDDLTETGDPRAWATLPATAERLRERAKTIERHLHHRHPNLELLFLFIFQGIGRSGQISIHDLPDGSYIAVTSAADLETIAILSPQDRIALWSCTKTIEEIRKQADVISWSLLSNFYIWKQQRGLLEAALHEQAVLFVPISTIGEARQEAHRAWDRHAALYPNGQHVEVYHLYDDPTVPVYGIVEDGVSVAMERKWQ